MIIYVTVESHAEARKTVNFRSSRAKLMDEQIMSFPIAEIHFDTHLDTFFISPYATGQKQSVINLINIKEAEIVIKR